MCVCVCVCVCVCGTAGVGSAAEAVRKHASCVALHRVGVDASSRLCHSTTHLLRSSFAGSKSRSAAIQLYSYYAVDTICECRVQMREWSGHS